MSKTQKPLLPQLEFLIFVPILVFNLWYDTSYTSMQLQYQAGSSEDSGKGFDDVT